MKIGQRFRHFGLAPQAKYRRVEAGGQFSSLSLGIHEGVPNEGSLIPFFDFRDTQTEIGFGGRLTYNINRGLALEAEGNFFPAPPAL